MKTSSRTARRAVTSASSSPIITIASSSRGSVGGAGAAFNAASDSVACRCTPAPRSTPAAITARLTTQRPDQPEVLAEDEFVTAHRLGQDRVDAAPIDLPRDQADADEDRDEQADQRHRRQAEVLDDLQVLTRRELSDQIGDRHQQHGKRDDAVEDLVAHRVPEDVQGHERRSCASVERRAAGSAGRARGKSPRACHEPGSSRPARRRQTSPARRPRRTTPSTAARRDSGRRRSGRRRRAARGRTSLPRRQTMPASTRSQPRIWNGTISASVPAATSFPPATMPTRLQMASASPRMCELKNTVAPRSRRRRMMSRTSPAADRIEARHRLVEEHDLRIVDQRLGQADALDHALRVLAQLHAALGAETDFVEQRGDATRRVRRRGSRRAPRSRRAAPRPRRCRRSAGSPAGSRCAGASSTSPAGRSRIHARPDVGKISCISSLSVVVLPAPFGPRKPKTSPRATSRVRLSSAT